MNNRLKYYFDDFTTERYIQNIELAKKNYNFILFTDLPTDARFVLWRHDVDFSIHRALRLAQIENELNIKATYFVYPHCEFYNLFEKTIARKIMEIQSLGHDIALHFDSHFYGIDSEVQLEKYLLIEKRWLDETFGTDIKSFSFHNTNEFTMGCKQWQYSGLINTYAAYFQNNVGYCSDSHGIWRHRRLADVLEAAQDSSLQVLTHPEWWAEEVMSPRQRIQNCIDGRAAANSVFYDDLISKMKRENIDW